MKITKETLIGEAIEKNPLAADIMLSYGLHCVGCHVNAFESIEQGALGHGMSKKEIEKMMKEINEILKEIPKGVSISEKGAKKLKELAKRDKKQAVLRLEIVEGGCNGFKYDMNMKPKKEGDVEFESNGVKIFVDKNSLENLNGTEIDYIDGLNNAGFKIKNPNVKSSCGCGDSSSF